MNSTSRAETPSGGLQPPALTPTLLSPKPPVHGAGRLRPVPAEMVPAPLLPLLHASSGAFLLPSLSSPCPERAAMGTPWGCPGRGQDGGSHSLSPSLAAPSRWLASSRSCGTALWPSTGTKFHTSTLTRDCEGRLLREPSQSSRPLPPPAPHSLSRAQRHGLTQSARPGGWSWGRLVQSLPRLLPTVSPSGASLLPPKPHCCLKPLQGPLPKSWIPLGRLEGTCPLCTGSGPSPGTSAWTMPSSLSGSDFIHLAIVTIPKRNS